MIDPRLVIDLLLVGSAFGLVLCVWLLAVLLWAARRKSRATRLDARLGIDTIAAANARMSSSRPPTPARPREGGAAAGVDWLLTGPRQVVISALLAAGGFGAAYMLLGSTLIAAGVGVVAFFTLQLYVGHRARRRQALFEQQLVDALELASRSLRAGHPLSSAFELISSEMDRPVRDIFGAVCQQHAMGADLDQALGAAARRTDSPDLRLLSTSIAIQSRTGGNVAQLMDRIAVVIRERIRLGRRLRVLTAQTQLSKRVLIALPIVVFFIFGLINREYMDPFYATGTGRILLAVALVLLAVGSWVMNRMTALKY